ncbi:MAG: hypothetical protein IKX51_07905, partial [Bacteroidales bacterium]|nr:hypothetical protein [Bacteroidales bacterium]
MKNRVIITLAAIVIATLSSCNDKEKIEIDHNTYYPYSQPSFVTSVAQAESMSHDLLTTALEFATDTSLRNFSGYPIVTSTSDTSFPRTISIDFGNSDTTTLLHTSLNDFRTRSGILNVTLSDDWHTTGSNMVITATSLRLSNTMTFTGVLEFANRGTRTYQSKPCYVFDFVTNNATVTKNDGYSFRYS